MELIVVLEGVISLDVDIGGIEVLGKFFESFFLVFGMGWFVD